MKTNSVDKRGGSNTPTSGNGSSIQQPSKNSGNSNNNNNMANKVNQMKLVGNYIIYQERLLGKGQYGKVYEASEQSNQTKRYAVKVIPSQIFTQSTNSQMLQKEIDVLKKLRHENLVCLHEISQSPNNLYLFLDYCNGGDLSQYIDSKPQKKLSESEAIKLFKEFVSGYQHLYESKIIHRDIKPENLMLHNGQIKLGDFGFGRFVEGNMNQQSRMSIKCTPIYASPQLLKKQQYSSKCDVWSSGCLLYKMLFGEYPFIAKDMMQLIRDIESKVCQGKELAFNAQAAKDTPLSDEVKTLLRSMLKYNEIDRISWEDIFKHPVLKKSSISILGATNDDQMTESDKSNPIFQSIMQNRNHVLDNDLVSDTPSNLSIRNYQTPYTPTNQNQGSAASPTIAAAAAAAVNPNMMNIPQIPPPTISGIPQGILSMMPAGTATSLTPTASNNINTPHQGNSATSTFTNAIASTTPTSHYGSPAHAYKQQTAATTSNNSNISTNYNTSNTTASSNSRGLSPASQNIPTYQPYSRNITSGTLGQEQKINLYAYQPVLPSAQSVNPVNTNYNAPSQQQQQQLPLSNYNSKVNQPDLMKINLYSNNNSIVSGDRSRYSGLDVSPSRGNAKSMHIRSNSRTPTHSGNTGGIYGNASNNIGSGSSSTSGSNSAASSVPGYHGVLGDFTSETRGLTSPKLLPEQIGYNSNSNNYSYGSNFQQNSSRIARALTPTRAGNIGGDVSPRYATQAQLPKPFETFELQQQQQQKQAPISGGSSSQSYENSLQKLQLQDQDQVRIGKVDKVILFMRNQALFADVVMQLVFTARNKFTLSTRMFYELIYSLTGFYNSKLEQLKRYLSSNNSTGDNLSAVLVNHNISTTEDFAVYLHSKQYKKTEAKISKDSETSNTFFKTLTSGILKELAINMNAASITPAEIELIKDFEKFIRSSTSNPHEFRLRFTQAARNALALISIDKFEKDTNTLRAIRGMQIFVKLEEFMPLKEFLTFDFRLFYEQHMNKVESETLLKAIKTTYI